MNKSGNGRSSCIGNLYSKDNVLPLTNALKFQNTTTILGSRRIPTGNSIKLGAKGHFSGYVFRGDTRPPEEIFMVGFMPRREVKNDEQLKWMTGSVIENVTVAEGISTVFAHTCALIMLKTLVIDLKGMFT